MRTPTPSDAEDPRSLDLDPAGLAVRGRGAGTLVGVVTVCLIAVGAAIVGSGLRRAPARPADHEGTPRTAAAQPSATTPGALADGIGLSDLSGLGVLAGGVALAASIAGWARAARRSRRALGALHDARGSLRLARSQVTDLDRQLRAVERLSGWTYWESDAHGRLRSNGRAQPGPADPHPASRLRAWLMSDDARVRLGTAATRSASPGDGVPGARPASLRAQLADGSGFALDAFAVARTDERGLVAGYYGLVRERRPASPAEYVERLGLSALAGVPVPAALLCASRSPFGVPHWRLVWSNAAANAQTGMSQPELAASEASGWIVPDADDPMMIDIPAPRISDRLAHVLAAVRPTQCRGALVDRFGVRRPAVIRVEPLEADGDESLRLVLVDVRPLELERLRQLAVVMEHARKRESARALELEVTARELESFSYTVSHDLRAPIRVVDGFAKALIDDFGPRLDDTARLHLRRIVAATNRMNAMIDALLELGRISARPVEPHPVDLSTIAKSIAEELRSQEPTRDVSFHIADGVVARGDPILLRIALDNLLRNAWKFTARTRQAHVTFDAREADGEVVYRVADNGVGFDMSLAHRLFGVFQRLHGAGDFPGTGIGLATVQRIVRRHGGRVWAESQPGMGARFMFSLWDLDSSAAVPR